MSSFSFEADGIEELTLDLKKAMVQQKEDVKKELKKIAKDFKKSAIARTPDGNTRAAGQEKKKLIKKYGIKIVGEGTTTTALVFNSGRHFHLVENGHNLVRGNKVVGFVAGKHMMEQTQNEYRDIVPDRLEKIVDEVLRRNDL